MKRGSSLTIRVRVDDALSPQAPDATLQVVDATGRALHRCALGGLATGRWSSSPPLAVDLPRGSYQMRILAHDLAGNAQADAGTARLSVE